MDEIACKKINKYMSKNKKNTLFSFVLYDNHNSYGTALSYPQYHRKPFSDEDPSISIKWARFKEKYKKLESFRKSDFKTIFFMKN